MSLVGGVHGSILIPAFRPALSKLGVMFLVVTKSLSEVQKKTEDFTCSKSDGVSTTNFTVNRPTSALYCASVVVLQSISGLYALSAPASQKTQSRVLRQ